MIQLRKTLSCALALVVLAGQAHSAEELIAETDEAFHERMEWFTDSQFGLFIHYGVYSTLGGEWNGESINGYAEWIQRWGKITPEEYIPLAKNFRPDKLDADLWVKTAKEAGMKYMVITTKHHEGFCLWNSALTDYDLGDQNDFDRDILGELKAACDKHGLKFGTYYSIIDWHHPSQRAERSTNQTPMNDKEGYVKYMKGQLKELIDNYDPAIMWFDGDWANWWTLDDGTDLYNYLRELSPEMIINNRVSKRREFKKDYGTPENSTPGDALDHVWEACWTVNHSWGFKKSDTTWKSIDELIQKQIDINTKGGNLLLNVGPKADGSWPEGSTKLLTQMGDWNREHEEAVYETELLESLPQDWGRLSQTKASDEESGELFAYVFAWPDDGLLKIEGIETGSVEATTYDGAALPVELAKDGITVKLSSTEAKPHATVLRLKYSGGIKVKKPTNTLELKGDELILQAPKAKLAGKELSLKNNTLVAGWKVAADQAEWSLDIPAPGKYDVKVLYSYDFVKPSEITLSVGDRILKEQINPTGSQTKFKLIDLGEMNLDEVGTTTCTVSFAEMQGTALMNLKTIYFVPVSE
ncbi:MAG: alpha-L-fucosidase [Luteolibacter sp.]